MWASSFLYCILAKSEINFVFAFLNIQFLFVLDLSNRDERNLLIGVLKTFKNIQIIRLRVKNYQLESYSDWHSKHHACFEKHPQSISTDFVVISEKKILIDIMEEQREGREIIKFIQFSPTKNLNKLLTLDTFFTSWNKISYTIDLKYNSWTNQVVNILDLIHKHKFLFSL